MLTLVSFLSFNKYKLYFKSSLKSRYYISIFGRNAMKGNQGDLGFKNYSVICLTIAVIYRNLAYLHFLFIVLCLLCFKKINASN